MLTCANMMTRMSSGTVLTERLARLPMATARPCVSDYEWKAEEIRKSKRFPTALRQFRALADENRLTISSLLKRAGELCACEIQAATSLTHPTVSHHMAVLVEAGIVSGRRRGKWMYYRMAGPSPVGLP
jgi:DNA-binding transcriptional ArsR family regulator